jgi:glycosyltransferase involved in cell wall biosynthesis
MPRFERSNLLLNVLHILNTGEVRGTGIAKIVRTIATRAEGRYRVTAWFVYEDGPLVAWLGEAGVEARYVPWRPSLRNPAGPLNLWKTCRSESPALVHHHSADTRVRWLVRHSVGAPILLHLHGRAAETAAAVPTTMSTRYADRVITVSQAVSEFTRTPSQVVYTGVEVAPIVAREESRGEIVIGTAARLVQLKAIDRLIRAFAKVHRTRSDVRLEIAGSGPERERLESLAVVLGLRDAVRFLGWRDRVREVMQHWSIYVQPSVEEGLGHSILEAMAEGLPVVAADVGGIPEVVVEGETGWLVPSGDEETFVRRLEELVADEGMRRVMGVRGRARIEDCFSAGPFAKRIETIYDEMLAESPRPTLTD